VQLIVSYSINNGTLSQIRYNINELVEDLKRKYVGILIELKGHFHRIVSLKRALALFLLEYEIRLA
jgi:hypothetical protein